MPRSTPSTASTASTFMSKYLEQLSKIPKREQGGSQKTQAVEAVEGVDRRKPVEEVDERHSCWWCKNWVSSGKCVDLTYRKVFAIANGTLQRCPGYQIRPYLLPEDVGFCVVCGCQVKTTPDWFYPHDQLPSSLYCSTHHPFYSQKKEDL